MLAPMTVNFDQWLPEGQTLYDYQHVGVAAALLNTADGLGTWIADEQGLGKTRQAIVTAKVRGCRNIVVVCKSSLKANWQREFDICAPEWDTQILQGSRPYEAIARVKIISFDLLATWADALIEEQPDCLIIDESHYVKSVGTAKTPVKRTLAALKVGEYVRNRQGLVLLLSGTPLLNRPVELVTQLQLIGRLQQVSPRPRYGDTDRDWEFAFKHTFCDGKKNSYGKWEFKGASQTKLLNTRLRSCCFIRRLRNEVLDMQDTHRVHTPLSLNGGLDAYHRIEDNFDPSAPGAYLKLLTELRQAVGLAKIPAAIDWIQNYIEENEGKKLVVWAWHVPVQRDLAAALNEAGIKAEYFGAYVPGSDEQEAAKARFNQGDVQVLVCSLQAHREGHTLVGNGHNVTDSLFVEMPWHPGAVSQAEDRINRIGQNAEVVFATTLLVPDTIDGWLADLIASKWANFRAVADGSAPDAATMDTDIQNIILARLREHMEAKLKAKGGDAA